MQLQIPKQRFDAAIFDCDGTLVDSMPLHHQAWKKAFELSGARFDFHWDLFMSRAGMGLEQTILELNQQFGEQMDPARVLADQHAHYELLLPQLRPLESVVRWARDFAGKLPQCVASGGQKAMVLRSLEVVGVAELFDHVICQVDVERGKPFPDMFLLCAGLMGVAPERCLVFEDGEPGIEAARAAGMPWVAADGSGRCSGPALGGADAG